MLSEVKRGINKSVIKKRFLERVLNNYNTLYFDKVLPFEFFRLRIIRKIQNYFMLNFFSFSGSCFVYVLKNLVQVRRLNIILT